MKKALFYLALTCWMLGLLIHLLSIADINVTEKVPFVWVLHLLIFVVWFPVVLDLKNNEELQEYQQAGMLNRMSPIDFFKIAFKETPTWMSVIAVGGFLYAVVNFILFITSQGGTPDIVNGQYVLQNHGQIIETLTEQEFQHYKANEVRGFSGHWILFYGIATAILYKYSGLEAKHDKMATDNNA
jgi:hypothetical protein